MSKIKTRVFVSFLGILIVAGIIFATLKINVWAVSPSIVVNEMMYHPQSNNELDEFIELHNTTSSSIDLEGWCFTVGVSLCFGPGTSIAANGFAVVSPDAARTLSVYGVTTIGTYTGKLDNGGETITLKDYNSNTVNSFTYDDVPPWPTSPDGNGPSLALKNPTKDNALPTSWAACPCGSSPGVANLIFTAGLPDIINLSIPQNVTPSTTPTVTVDVNDATTVSLVYKIMFGSEVTVPMYDDGGHGDGTALDGTYGATIPPQAAGSLVRYKVTATNNYGTQTKPGGEETINYQGYVIQDAALSTQLPVLQWFMEPAEFTDMVTNHDFDDQQFTTVIAYGNTVIDNALISVKGGVKRTFNKKSFAVDLPNGHKLQISGMPRPVDEFHIDSDFTDASGSSLVVAWQIAAEQGMDVPYVFKTRIQQNGQFFGVYTFLEEYDKQWRQAFGYENTAFYKTNTPKTDVVVDFYADLLSWRDNLNVERSNARRTYALDNLDVPNMINYMAFMALIRNWEWHNGKNMNKSHDVLDTGRWRVLPQDIDGTLTGSVSGAPYTTLVSPYDESGYEMSYDQRFQFFALYDEPDFREMYYRRLRTLADEYLSSNLYLNMYRDQYSKVEGDIFNDHAKWGTYYDPITAKSRIENTINRIKRDMLVRYRQPWALPAAQSSNPTIDIDVVNPSPLNQDDEYIKLKNNGAESVDMSGWRLVEIDYRVPYGSVLLAGQSVIIPKKDLLYKTAHPGTYMLSQYVLSVNDNNSGKLTLNRSDGSESSTKWY